MKINPQDIQVPLEKIVSYTNGQVEVSLAKMSEEKSEKYKKFMATCMSNDKSYVDTEGMDKDNAQKACAMYWDKSKGKIEIEIEEDEPEDVEEKEDMEEGDASGQSTKMLSKKNASKEVFDGETLKINK
jgi:hypothetical protein